MRAMKATLVSTTVLASVLVAGSAFAQSTDEQLAAYFDKLAAIAPPNAILEIGPISNGTMAGFKIGEEGDFLMTAEAISFSEVEFSETGGIDYVGTLGFEGLTFDADGGEVTMSAVSLDVTEFSLGQLLVVQDDELQPNPGFNPMMFVADPSSIVGGFTASTLAIASNDEYEPFAATMDSVAAGFEGQLLSVLISNTQATAAPDGDNVALGIDEVAIEGLNVFAFESQPSTVLEILPTSFSLTNFLVNVTPEGAPGAVNFVIGSSSLEKSGDENEGSVSTRTAGIRLETDEAMLPPDAIATLGPAAQQLIVDGKLVITGQTGYDVAWSSANRSFTVSDLELTLDNLIQITGGVQLDNLEPSILLRGMVDAPTSREEEDSLQDMQFTAIDVTIRNQGLVELAQTNPMFMMFQGMGASGLMQFQAEVQDERVQDLVGKLTNFVQNPQSLALSIRGSDQASPRQLDELMSQTSGPADGFPILLDVFSVSMDVNK